MLTTRLELTLALRGIDMVDACLFFKGVGGAFIYWFSRHFLFCGAVAESLIKLVVDLNKFVFHYGLWIDV